ncbi:MAG: hypothetical protein GF329_16190 [Candidatus Lokiarchaeota archaeon]|nr:hypothetical protein [Candidatus Lokiarchaeota archaeon]
MNYYFFIHNKQYRKNIEGNTTKIIIIEKPSFFFLKKNGKILGDVIFKQKTDRTAGIALFRIENIPLGIKDSLYKYIKSLYRHSTDFIWFYNVSTRNINSNQSDAPNSVPDLFDDTLFNNIEEINNEMNNRKKQSSTDIIFGHRKVMYKKIKDREKFQKLYRQIKTSIIKTNSKLAEALPHAKIKILSSNELKYVIKNIFLI